MSASPTSGMTWEEKRWNRFSEHMNKFHSYFKFEFNQLYELADGSFNKHGLNLRGYLGKAYELERHITFHHTFEEQYIFPVLAKRMPEFSTDSERDGDGAHISSHRRIHDGLEELGTLVKKWKASPASYSPDEMKACLDGFREVLFEHLDKEVEDIGGENMKRYWTLDEMDNFVF